MSVPNYMHEIANEHNKLFKNHKVTGVYSNDMVSGYEFDGINDASHNIEQLDLQEYFADDTCEFEYHGKDSDGTIWDTCTMHNELAIHGAFYCSGYQEDLYSKQTLEGKAHGLNELITAMNEGI